MRRPTVCHCQVTDQATLPLVAPAPARAPCGVLQERILRVYTPRTEPAYQVAVGQALAAWCKQRFGTNIQLATPARPRLLVERLPREVRVGWCPTMMRAVAGARDTSRVGRRSGGERVPGTQRVVVGGAQHR